MNEKKTNSSRIFLILIIVFLLLFCFCLGGFVIYIYFIRSTTVVAPSQNQIKFALTELSKPTLTEGQIYGTSRPKTTLAPSTQIIYEVDRTEFEDNVQPYLQSFVEAANKVADLSDQMSYDSNIIYDQTWRIDIFEQMDKKVNALCSIANMDFPQSYVDFHTYITQACEEERLFRADMKLGIENADVSILNQAETHLNNVNSFLDQAVSAYQLQQ
jgi:hypothetical protein